MTEPTWMQVDEKIYNIVKQTGTIQFNYIKELIDTKTKQLVIHTQLNDYGILVDIINGKCLQFNSWRDKLYNPYP